MRKMIIRADDVGYTHVFDLGALESMRSGVVTAADVMLDAPDAVGALKALRKMPWISVGWHTHFWCSPVLPPEQVPTLVIPGTGRFRHDLSTTDTFSPEELEAECRAEMDLCLNVLGRVPDTTDLGPCTTLLEQVKQKICDDYGIAYHFATKEEPGGTVHPQPRWEDRKIWIAPPVKAYQDILNDSITHQYEQYDPVRYYTEDWDGILSLPEDVIFAQAWHPGYVDYFVYKGGDFGPNAKFFTAIRTQDVAAMTSPVLHDWIRDHKIALVNYRDALYGTRDFQNHLLHTESDLYVAPF